MICHVVTEGKSDVTLLTELLGTEASEIIEAGGWSGADAYARSILAARKEPVALVIDAGTSDPNRVMERRQFMENSLGQVGPHDLWRVYLVVPEIEALLFTDRDLLEGLVEQAISEEDYIRGRYEPKKVLEKLLNGKPRQKVFEDRLPKLDLSSLYQLPLVRELRQFIVQSTQPLAGQQQART